MRNAGNTAVHWIGLREIKNTGLLEHETLEVTLPLVSDLRKVISGRKSLFSMSFVSKSNFVYF